MVFARTGCRKSSWHGVHIPMVIKDTSLNDAEGISKLVQCVGLFSCTWYEAKDTRSPNWKHFNHAFDFFNLLNAAKPPRIYDITFVHHVRCLVSKRLCLTTCA